MIQTYSQKSLKYSHNKIFEAYHHDIIEADPVKKYRGNPVRYLKDKTAVRPWEKQKEILNAVVDNRLTAIRAGQGVGKTYIMAGLVQYWLDVYDECKIITTAPGDRQIKKQLWPHIRSFYAKSQTTLPPPLIQEWNVNPDKMALGFSVDDPVDFQGYHSPNCLIIIDEAPGVSDDKIAALQGNLTTGANQRLVLIGNPLISSGQFYRAFHSEKSIWKNIHISCLDAPDYIVSPEWINEKRIQWGEDGPLWQAKILGEFPDEGEFSLIRLSWVEQCKHLFEPKHPDEVLAVDVARFGSNRTSMAHMKGGCLVELESWQGNDLMTTVGKIVRKFDKLAKCAIIPIDDTGVGGGVTDRLHELGYPAHAVNFGSTKTLREKENFTNLKAEMYWGLRTALENKTISLNVDDPKLEGQLVSIQYGLRSDGRVELESKKDMKMASPDEADAVAMGHYFSGYSSRKSLNAATEINKRLSTVSAGSSIW